MEPMRLIACAPHGGSWSLWVKDKESGKKLYFSREGWFIIREHKGCIALDCQVLIDYEKFRGDTSDLLRLEFDGEYLTCEEGQIKLLEPASRLTQQGVEMIGCVIMIDGFSNEEAK